MTYCTQLYSLILRNLGEIPQMRTTCHINHSATQTRGGDDSMKSNPYAHRGLQKIKIANHVHDKHVIVKYH